VRQGCRLRRRCAALTGHPLDTRPASGHSRATSATHHPEKPMATATDASVADHRPKGRPVGTYTTHTGA